MCLINSGKFSKSKPSYKKKKKLKKKKKKKKKKIWSRGLVRSKFYTDSVPFSLFTDERKWKWKDGLSYHNDRKWGEVEIRSQSKTIESNYKDCKKVTESNFNTTLNSILWLIFYFLSLAITMITMAIFSFSLPLTCSCEISKNGSPCSHQAAIVFHCNIESVNFVPTLHPLLCQDIAFLVLGNKAIKNIEFYSALHEEIKPVSTAANIATTNPSDFTGTSLGQEL